MRAWTRSTFKTGSRTPSRLIERIASAKRPAEPCGYGHPLVAVRHCRAIGGGSLNLLPFSSGLNVNTALHQPLAAAAAVTDRRSVVHHSPIARRRIVLLEHVPSNLNYVLPET
jgi:hypothetical protein